MNMLLALWIFYQNCKWMGKKKFWKLSENISEIWGGLRFQLYQSMLAIVSHPHFLLASCDQYCWVSCDIGLFNLPKLLLN